MPWCPVAELDLPKASVKAELERLFEGARADLKQRGIADAETTEIPEEIFAPKPNAACVWVWLW